jgi:hypothetical protein
MPKSITFFSRGKTPIYVNYVIAHNNVGDPLGYWGRALRAGKQLICRDGLATCKPLQV